MNSPYKSSGGLQRVFKAFMYSIQGLRAAVQYEAAFRQELFLAIILLPTAFFLGRNVTEIFLLCACIIIVLVVELINSAIEALADSISLEHHPLLGRAKDLGSAAVLLSLILTGAWWLYVVCDRFFL
ncbi:MAG: diacylglycerol kinase [Paenalcaligenes sp.]